MHFLLILFLLAGKRVLGAEFAVSSSSVTNPLGGRGTDSTSSSPLTNSFQTLTSVAYSDVVHSHQLQYSDPGYVTLFVKERGSERILLCLSKNTPCSARFDDEGNKIIVSGERIDLEGYYGFENLLQLEKPQGVGYIATVFLINERTYRMSSAVQFSSKFGTKLRLTCQYGVFKVRPDWWHLRSKCQLRLRRKFLWPSL